MTTTTDDHALCRGLIARADRMRRDQPGRALELARAGRTLAAGLDRTAIGEATWNALQTEAWSVLASTARAVGDLADAEAALNVALCFLSAAPYDEARRTADRARLAQRAAYVRADQRRFAEALDLIDDAADTYQALERPAAAATCRIDRAAILASAGSVAEALALLVQTLDRHAEELSPRSYLYAVHNIALYLYELTDRGDDSSPPTSGNAQPAEALEWLRLAIQCHRRRPDSIEHLKLVSLWGLTAARVGEVERGMAALDTAARGFERHGAFPAQARALLDLARLAIVHRRPTELVRVAGAIFPLLRRMRAHPDVRDGLVRVLRAIHLGSLETALIERVSGALRPLDAAAPAIEP